MLLKIRSYIFCVSTSPFKVNRAIYRSLRVFYNMLSSKAKCDRKVKPSGLSNKSLVQSRLKQFKFERSSRRENSTKDSSSDSETEIGDSDKKNQHLSQKQLTGTKLRFAITDSDSDGSGNDRFTSASEKTKTVENETAFLDSGDENDSNRPVPTPKRGRSANSAVSTKSYRESEDGSSSASDEERSIVPESDLDEDEQGRPSSVASKRESPGQRAAKTSDSEANSNASEPVADPTGKTECNVSLVRKAPVKTTKKRTGAVIISSDSEDADDNSTEHDAQIKEKRLGVLSHVFPHYDQMELQDCLVKNNWNVSSSMAQLRQQDSEKLRPAVKRRRIQVAVDSSGDDSDCTSRWRETPVKTPVVEAVASTSKRQIVVPVSDDSGKGKNRRKSLGVDSERKASTSKHSKREADNDEEEETYDNNAGLIYDSEDSDVDDRPTPSRKIVIDFYNDSTVDELIGIPGCTQKKANIVVEMRPFRGWLDLVGKLKSGRGLSTDLINSANDILKSRRIVTKLMRKCESIAERMGARVTRLLAGYSSEASLKEQPHLLAEGFTLAPYQLLGINWLLLMHEQRVNGILADEMGLGKTIQTIAFLASRWEEGDRGPHLIVAPASTVDNWEREIRTWCPSFKIIMYQGSLEERRNLRGLILSGRESKFNVMLATYNMVAGMPEDRLLFRRVRFHYVIFDEAHLLKNMATLRYQHLVKIRAERRLLLTGTPLQNNLVELMSLLVFVMPSMFDGKVEHLKSTFAIISKETSEDMKGNYERDRIEHAKRIMKPFILRRLKSEVLQQLPKKKEELIRCDLLKDQRKKYDQLIASFSKQVREQKENILTGSTKSGVGMMMQLRRLANHPLLMRYHYDDEKLREMAQLMLKEPTHENANKQFVFEDMQVMSDFELDRLCRQYQSLKIHILDTKYILRSGKFQELSRLLPPMKEKGDRVLLFSQFVIVLDIVESYMKLCGHKYLRLDGSTPIHDRQVMIDQYTQDNSIFLFMLSTKAGGLGINLTAANTVILHDIDFNPYNDKQAEDRCHRVGQTKNVKVIRMIAKDTIEEGIFQAAEQKLKLERDLTGTDGDEENEDIINVASLLKVALGL